MTDAPRFLILLRELALDLLAVVWPTACAGCGRADRELCDPCAREVRVCTVGRGEVAGRWLTLSCGEYAGVVRDLLVRFKHGGEYGLHRALGDRLAVGLAEALTLVSEERQHRQAVANMRGNLNDHGSPAGALAAPLIVPVPSRRSRVRSRGYAHMTVLAQRALRRTRRSSQAHGQTGEDALRAVVYSGLVATRGRSGQVGLSSRDRMRNARRVRVPARCERILRGRQVILIDDIVTTGATISAAAEALIGVGAQVTCVLAMCRAERNDSVEN